MTLLLLVQGVQTAVQWSHAATSQASVPQTPPERIAYYYTPDDLSHTASRQDAFQYAGYYAHATGAINVMPVRAYAPSTGRWLDRDPLPAK